MTASELHKNVIALGTGAIAILNKAAEIIETEGSDPATGAGRDAGGRAAKACGFSTDSDEYALAAETSLIVFMGRRVPIDDPTSCVAAFRETATTLQEVVDAECAKLQAALDAGN